MALTVGRNDFDAGNIQFEGHWKGWALKIKTFLGPEMAASEASAILGRKNEREVHDLLYINVRRCCYFLTRENVSILSGRLYPILKFEKDN